MADRWEPVTELTGSDILGSAGSGFGRALALAGDTLLVGAPGVAGDSGELQGAVYRFERRWRHGRVGRGRQAHRGRRTRRRELRVRGGARRRERDHRRQRRPHVGGAVYLSAELVQSRRFPPTAELADGILLEGPRGVLLGTAGGTLSASLPVWIVEVPPPALPLWPSTTALSSCYNVGAVVTTRAPASLPFAIAFPVPEGADTAHLGMAVLVMAEEATDSMETGPVWDAMRGFYDDQNNLFSAALPTLVLEGRTVVLIQDPAMTPVTLDEETPEPTPNVDVAKFDFECFDSGHPVNAIPTSYTSFRAACGRPTTCSPALIMNCPRCYIQFPG